MYNIIKYQPSEYGAYRFPAWAEALGILMGLFSCLMIPAGMLVAVLREEGTLWEVGDPEAPRKCAGVIPSPCLAWGLWRFAACGVQSMGLLVWGGHGHEGLCFGGAKGEQGGSSMGGTPGTLGGVPLLKDFIQGWAVELLAACSLPSSALLRCSPRAAPCSAAELAALPRLQPSQAGAGAR